MSRNDILTFDIQKCEKSGRLIGSESEKLKRMANKLQKIVEGTPTWWVGDSQNSFIRQMRELVKLTFNTAEMIAGMGTDMLDIALTKKEEEEKLRRDLLDAITLEFGSGMHPMYE